MAEPHTTSAGLIAGATIGAPLIVLGAHVDALVIGMLMATMMSIWMPTIDNRAKSMAAVGVSTVLAGYGSPLGVALIASQFDSLAPILAANGEACRMLAAACIGGAGPRIVPVLMRKAQAKAEGTPATGGGAGGGA